MSFCFRLFAKSKTGGGNFSIGGASNSAGTGTGLRSSSSSVGSPSFMSGVGGRPYSSNFSGDGVLKRIGEVPVEVTRGGVRR